ncbi:MAG: PilZ domain-containing protein [Deltaproteobacteria bacterium]|nr:PilZ domain-containing protein [Deltaproteobacteria bacterium]
MPGRAPLDERRKFPRATVHVHVQFYSLDGKHGGPPLLGITRDISAGGLAIEIPSFFATENLMPPEGSQVLVRFTLPDVPKAFKIPSRVAWTWNPPPTGMGVEFLSISDQDRTLIAEFVEQYYQQGP